MTTPARVRRRSILASSVAMLLGVTILSTAPRVSADQYWDGLSGNTTILEGGGGTWNKSIQNWSNSGGTINDFYDPTQSAIFSKLGGLVTLGDDLTITNLHFTGAGYQVEVGSTAHLLGVGGAVPITVDAGLIATINAGFQGSGSLNINGPGRLILGGTGTFTGGTTLSNGSLFINSAKALGDGTLTIATAGVTLGSSKQNTSFSNKIVVQNNFNIAGADGAGDFFIKGDIDLNGAARTITGTTLTQQIHFGGNISGGDLTLATSFTKTGDYVAFLLDAGTITGTTFTIGNGVFLVLPSLAQTLKADNVVIDGNAVIEYYNYLDGHQNGIGDQISDTATVTVNSKGNFVGSQRNTGLDLAGKSDTIGALNGNGTVSVGGGTLTVGAGTFSGVISDGYLGGGSGNLTKNTTGTLTLSGANIYTGTTTVANGTLQAGATNTFSKFSDMVVNNTGTLSLVTFDQTVASLAGAGVVDLGTATLTTGLDNSSTAFDGIIQGTGGLTKIGTGIMTLTGGNTYTGATTVNGGTLVVNTNNQNDVINAGSQLVMGGGTFQITGKINTDRSQTFGGFTLERGASVIAVDNSTNVSTANTTTVDLGGAINRNNHATVDFKSTAGVLDSRTIIKTTQANNANGVLGSWATVNGGAALAANDGAGNIVAYNTYDEIDVSGSTITDGGNNVRFNTATGSGNVALSDTVTNINTLTQNTTTTATIDLDGKTLRFGASGGIFITPGKADLVVGTATSPGVITAGGNVDGNPGELVLGNFSSANNLTINSVIADNGVGGTVTVTKTGAGAVILTGVNTYTGVTTVNQGVLTLNSSGGPAISGDIVVNGGFLSWAQNNQVATTSNLTLNSGTISIDAFTNTVNSVVMTGGEIAGQPNGVLTSLTAYDLRNGTVSAILAGTVDLNKTTDGTVVISAVQQFTGATVIDGGRLVMQTNSSALDTAKDALASSSGVSVNANGTWVLNGSSQTVKTLAGTGLIQILGTGTVLTVGGPDNQPSTFDGVIEGDGGLTKKGTGSLTLTKENLYTGATTVSEGTLVAGVANILNGYSILNVASGASFIGGGFDQIAGTLAGAGTIDIGAGNLTVGRNTTTSEFTGVIQGSGKLIKIGGGSLTLSGANTYTGLTSVQGGQLHLAGTLVGGGLVEVDNDSVFYVDAGGNLTRGDTVTVVTLKNSNDQTSNGNAVQIDGQLVAGNNAVGVGATNGARIINNNILTVGDASTGVKLVSNNRVNNNGTLTVGNNGAIGIDGVDSNTINSTTMNVGTSSTGIRLVSNNTATSNGTMTLGVNAIGFDAGSGNALRNSGKISGSDTGTTGLILRGKGNTVVNEADALVSASKAIVFTSTSAANTIVNYGTLTGVSGISIDASLATKAVNFYNLGAGNSSFDTSLLDLTKLNIVNTGTLNGLVAFSANDDIATLATGGKWKDTLDGAGGNNSLRLIGTGTDTLNLKLIKNFDYLSKRGGGTWTLTGEGTFTGGSNIEMGTLSVQGNLISNVRIWAEGVLGGTGTITGNVVNVGTLNPGNSPGKITITGNYEQQRTGTMVIEVAGKGAGQHDLVAVGGQAKLDGTLRVEKVGKAPRLKIGDRITFLTAGGGVDGEFSKLEDNYTTGSMIKAKVVYESNLAYLEGVQGSFTQFADQSGLTPNQRSTAQAVDKAVEAGKDKKIVQYLNNRELKDIPHDLDRIAPEELTAMYHVSVGLANVQAQNVDRRMDDLRITNRRLSSQAPVQANTAPGAGGPTGYDGTPGKVAVPLQQRDRWGTFFTGTGQISKVGQTDNARGYDLDTGGLTVGVDYLVTDHLAVGLTVGYANTAAKLTEGGRISINGGKIGAYGTYFLDGFHIDGAINGGFNSYDIKRAALDGTARGQTEGFEFSTHLAAGYDWKVDEFTLSPLASVQYTYVGFDDYTEHGSISPLKVPSQSGDSISSTLGIKAAYDWEVGSKLLRPELTLAWRHEYGDRNFSIDAELPSGAGGAFSVVDSELGRDSLLLTAGVSMIWSPTTVFYLFYDGELERKEYQAHNLSGGMRLSF